MRLFELILSAIGALVGPAEDAIKALFSGWRDFHQTSDTSPAQLIQDATDAFSKVKTLVSDVDTQIALVSQSLQEKHSDLPATVAHTAAAAAVHKG